jgi:hypothetical protein
MFNAVQESLIRPLQEKWRSRGRGVSIGEGAENQLCNLRFADDLLLISTSRHDLEVMLKELEQAAKRVGLELHMGKTKILCNLEDASRGGSNYIEMSGHKLDILKLEESTMYLGRALTFGSLHDTEIQNRINRGWA